MKIVWNKVTWYSKLIAVIMGIVILALGIYLGMAYQATQDSITMMHTGLIQNK